MRGTPEKLNLTDFDSIGINVYLLDKGAQSDQDPFLYLEHYIIDLRNMLAFKKDSKKGEIYRLVRSVDNDRTRSRLIDRKPFDFTAASKSNYSSVFDKDVAEFA